MIKSEAEYEETLNMISELMDGDPEPDSDQGKLLERLCLLTAGNRRHNLEK